jgi:heme-degrading monooxygenase HmoA
MYARVSTIQGSADQIDEGIERVRETTLPAIKEIDGFKGIVSLVDRQTGKGLTVTLWESEDKLQASEEQANKLRAEAAGNLGASGEPTVERYEVALYEIEAPIGVQ